MSETYLELTHSNYPQQKDKLMVFRDPSVSEVDLINQYNSLIASGQVASAIDILSANPSLNECIINADKLLSLHHSILAVQRFFYDNVQEKIYRMGQQKGDWHALMSSDASTEENKLNMYDIVRYPIDGIKQYFMVISSEIMAGTLPTDASCYMQMTMKGDKGDTGYTPVKGVDYFDGVDGAPGLGMSPRGIWISNKQYYQYDLVSHNGFLWYALNDTVAEEPSDESSVWVKIPISLQIAYGASMPINLEDGGLWMHLQDDGHVILKTKDASGTYKVIHPETQAKYIFDATGTNLQRKLYQNYFERDDVTVTTEENNNVITITATLHNNQAIIVAKMVQSDNLDTDSTVVTEYTAYDETGIYVMYKSIKTITVVKNEDGSETYHKTTDIVV